ncbi:lipase family protein [Pseudomonas sp. LRF_L74]|uniref:lipase family protein n=1 Tax=Pseudomonas sp. LRF_L74 TaxID=3369422 RepID=UPI003F5DE040
MSDFYPRCRTLLGCVALLLSGSPSYATQVFDARQGDMELSPFYAWSARVPAHGALLRHQPLPASQVLQNALIGERILYSSTDGLDGQSRIYASAQVFIPRGQVPAGGWPTLIWGHGAKGLADVCAPSWAGYSQKDQQYLNQWLASGFAIVASDYQGLGVTGPHPLMNVPALAFSMLDAVLGARSGFPALSGPLFLVGHSQGGTAAIAAASYASSYTPDLQIAGVVASGIVFQRHRHAGPLPDDRDPADSEGGDPSSIRYDLLNFMVAQQLEPELMDEDRFKPDAIPLLNRLRTACTADVITDAIALGRPRSQLLVMHAERYQAFLRKRPELIERYQTFPRLDFAFPAFIPIGASDLALPASNQLQLVKDICDAGTHAESRIYAGAGHGDTAARSFDDAIAFARRVQRHTAVACPRDQATAQGDH